MKKICSEGLSKETEVINYLKRCLRKSFFMPSKINFDELYKIHCIYAFTRKIEEEFGGDRKKMVDFYSKENKAEFNNRLELYRVEWDQKFSKELEIFRAMPKEILRTVKDIRVFVLGHYTKRTQKCIEKYLRHKVKSEENT